jgi:hypothetical protein
LIYYSLSMNNLPRLDLDLIGPRLHSLDQFAVGKANLESSSFPQPGLAEFQSSGTGAGSLILRENGLQKAFTIPLRNPSNRSQG